MNIEGISVVFAADVASLLAGVQSVVDSVSSVSGSAVAVDELTTSVTEATAAVEELGTTTVAVEELGTAIADLSTESASIADVGAEVENTSSMFEQAIAAVSDYAAGVMDSMSQAATAVMDFSTQSKEQLSNAFSSAKEGATGAMGGIMGFGQGLLGVIPKVGMAMFGVQALVQTAGQIGGALLGADASMEQTQTAFKTLEGSSSAANDEIQKLVSFAATTPFHEEGIETAAEKMLAFKFSNQQVIPTIKAIGDTLSALGKSSDSNLGSIVDIFGKIQAQGKLTGGDMMQLSRWGVPAWQLLAQATGLPIPELQKMVSKGLIPAKQAIADLSGGMEKMYGGGMLAQSKTFNGEMSTLQDNVKSAWREFSGPLFDAAKAGLMNLGNLVSSPQFAEFAKTMGKDVAGAMGAAGKGMAFVGSLISTQIGPPLQHLGQVVGPLVQDFVVWATKNDVLGKAMGVVQTVVTLLAQSIGLLINGLASTINFFAQNQLALDILLAVLAGVAGAILIFAATAIPALVVGFIAWAVAAGTAAIATLTAAAPFILIGLIIAAVVLGIILAVQHWGAITSWLSGVWSAFSSWFMGALQAVGAFFIGVWNHIVSGVQAAWTMIVNIVKIALLVLLVIIFAPIIAIAALFIWLYQHNTYFKMLVDAIINFVKAGVAWLVDAWHNTINWIVSAWQFLVTAATMYFMLIYVTISAKVQQVVGFLHGIWTSVIGFLAGIWTTIATNVSQMWSTISGFFSSAWSTYISGPLNSLWSSITGFVSGWAGQAVQWGVNLIQGFINGITSMLGNVGSAVSGIASKVASFLGFHSPAKEGPGRELDVWAPNMVKEFAQGLDEGVPLIQAAVTHLIQPTSALGSYQGGSNTPSSSLQGNSGGGQSHQEHHFHIYLDSKELAPTIGEHIVREIRIATGSKAA